MGESQKGSKGQTKVEIFCLQQPNVPWALKGQEIERVCVTYCYMVAGKSDLVHKRTLLYFTSCGKQSKCKKW